MRAGMIFKVAMLMLVAAGCGATIRSSTASNADLAKYRTYSFYTSPKANQPETIADQAINSSLKDSLAAKGLTEAAPGQTPDFLVAHHVKEQQQLDVDNFGYGFYGWPGGEVTQYTQGTLIVDFIDPQTKQVFWRGTASGVVNHPNSPNTQKIAKVVGEVVNRYPSAVAEAPRTTM